MGKLEVICGPMFSGKTSELLKRIRRSQIAKQSVMVFKPKIDNRYAHNKIQNHDGDKIPASIVSNSIEIEIAIQNFNSLHSKNPDVIAIDEVQFFDYEIIELIKKIKDKGTRVIVSGLDMDFNGDIFNITSDLMGYADIIDKQTAICVVCGKEATQTYKKNKNNKIIEIGGKEEYEARCYHHWKK